MKPINKLFCTLCNICRIIINEGHSDHLICPKCQEKAIILLKTLASDAQLALSDEWDRSDEGFEAQLKSINKFLKLTEDE